MWLNRWKLAAAMVGLLLWYFAIITGNGLLEIIRDNYYREGNKKQTVRIKSMAEGI